MKKTKRRKLRRICERKIKYTTPDAGEAAAHAMTIRFQKLMNAYGCRICGGWHIGHNFPAWARNR